KRIRARAEPFCRFSVLGRIKIDLNAAQHGIAIFAPKLTSAMQADRKWTYMPGLTVLPHRTPAIRNSASLFFVRSCDPSITGVVRSRTPDARLWLRPSIRLRLSLRAG